MWFIRLYLALSSDFKSWLEDLKSVLFFQKQKLNLRMEGMISWRKIIKWTWYNWKRINVLHIIKITLNKKNWPCFSLINTCAHFSDPLSFHTYAIKSNKINVANSLELSKHFASFYVKKTMKKRYENNSLTFFIAGRFLKTN